MKGRTKRQLIEAILALDRSLSGARRKFIETYASKPELEAALAPLEARLDQEAWRLSGAMNCSFAEARRAAWECGLDERRAAKLLNMRLHATAAERHDYEYCKKEYDIMAWRDDKDGR